MCCPVLVPAGGEVQHWSLGGVLDAAAVKLEEESRLGHCISVSCTVCFLSSKGCEKTLFK